MRIIYSVSMSLFLIVGIMNLTTCSSGNAAGTSLGSDYTAVSDASIPDLTEPEKNALTTTASLSDETKDGYANSGTSNVVSKAMENAAVRSGQPVSSNFSALQHLSQLVKTGREGYSRQHAAAKATATTQSETLNQPISASDYCSTSGSISVDGSIFGTVEASESSATIDLDISITVKALACREGSNYADGTLTLTGEFDASGTESSAEASVYIGIDGSMTASDGTDDITVAFSGFKLGFSLSTDELSDMAVLETGTEAEIIAYMESKLQVAGSVTFTDNATGDSNTYTGAGLVKWLLENPDGLT